MANTDFTFPQIESVRSFIFFRRYFTPALQLPILKPVPHQPGIRQRNHTKKRRFIPVSVPHSLGHNRYKP
jgi:hypothetical protein